MNPLAILYWALLAASSPGDEERQVRELLPALEDDSIERREKAVAGLLDLGERAAPALRAALEAVTSPEARGRIGDVLRRLDAGRRRKEFRGGEVQKGLAAAVRIVDADPSTILVQVEVMNVGEDDAAFAPIQWWNLQLPHARFVSNLSEGLLEIRQLSGEPCGEPLRARLCVGGPRSRPSVLHLKPSESRTYEYRLDRSALPKGEYSVEIEYYSTRLLGTPENLKSNALKFSVDR